VNDQVIGEFKDFLKANDIAYTDQDIAGVRDWIDANIQSEIFTSQFGQQEGLKVRAQWDPMIQKALGYLPQAQSLEENAEKIVAMKASARSTANPE
jgi:carboxyl-terminal processing protease